MNFNKKYNNNLRFLYSSKDKSFEIDSLNIKDQFYILIIFKAIIRYLRKLSNILINIKRYLKITMAKKFFLLISKLIHY